MLLDARPLLCWGNRKYAVGKWTRSPDNQYWSPNQPWYPDTSKLQAGDIILYRPVRPTATQRLIRAYEIGQFTHAAIYLQTDHSICEASAAERKVIVSSLEDTLKNSCLLFRRIRDLTPDGRNRMAAAAMDLHKEKYDFYPLIKQIVTRSVRLKELLGIDGTEEFIHPPLICSSLCEHAILAGLADGRSVTKRNGHLIMPEDLAASSLLEDVDIQWKNVE